MTGDSKSSGTQISCAGPSVRLATAAVGGGRVRRAAVRSGAAAGRKYLREGLAVAGDIPAVELTPASLTVAVPRVTVAVLGNWGVRDVGKTSLLLHNV